MNIKLGKGKTIYGTGVDIELSGKEVATAIMTYLTAHGIYVSGARTIFVNGNVCETGKVYVDPSGFAIGADGKRYDGCGEMVD